VNWKKEWKVLALMVGGFLAAFYVPVESVRFQSAIVEAFHLTKWYAREHVLLCLVPAFFIAGAIAVFVGGASVMKYLGAKAKKSVAYAVASVSGSVLAVCSCTVLPLFAGIYRMGAGLGPATAFLYSGPAVNVLAIVLTARVLGVELGVARAVGAVVFSIVIGLLMQLLFRKEEEARVAAAAEMPEADSGRALWQDAVYFATLVAILVFATWGAPESEQGLWAAIHGVKWYLTGVSAALLGLLLVLWFSVKAWKVVAGAGAVVLAAALLPGYPLVPFTVGTVALSIVSATDEGEVGGWFESTWGFAKQILPLLLFGVLIAGAFLGRPGHEGLIPSEWVETAVGGNSLRANFVASFAGAFMYFATLTEVPILDGLLGAGMGKGPALALLLAGPALSLPNMLVIRSVMGTKKTAVFVLLVVLMATASGMLFGVFFS